MPDAGTLLVFSAAALALIRRLRGRVACYSELTRASAERHGSTVVDLWGMTPLADPRSWGLDRLHLTEEGHRRVALRTLETLGVPVLDDWRAPFPAADPAPAEVAGPAGLWLGVALALQRCEVVVRGERRGFRIALTLGAAPTRAVSCGRARR